MSKFPSLFSPLRVGPIEFKNRVVMSGHHLGLGDGRGGVGPRLHGYVVERARGGAAMVGLESSPVHPTSIKGVRPHLFDDAVIPDLRSLADAVHDAGSRLSVILWHAGHNMTHLGAGPAWAPSAVPSAQFNDLPKAMTQDDIAELIAAFAAAAQRCRSAGLDAVEVQTSSDYLLGSFLNPVFNRRTDDYGGSLENRMRIVVQAAAAVREAVAGELAIGVRTSVAHNVPGDPGGYGEDESLGVMRELVDRGLVDYVSLITGSHFSLSDLMPPMTVPTAHLRSVAARFRATLDIPVMFAGNIRTPDQVEGVLASGDADLVALARPWIVEPHWLAKVEAGKPETIRPCISCNQACTFAQRGIGPATCSINPTAGREFERPARRVARKRKEVVVVGGGPAGLETAHRAAVDGHSVTLFEAKGQLGGDMWLAGTAPHRGPILGAIAWWENALTDLGVTIRLGEEIAAQSPPDADVVVWAVGSEPAQSAVWRRRPHLLEGIPGTEAAPHGRQVLDGGVMPGGSLLVIDEEGGWPTVSLIDVLASSPDVGAITVVTPGQHPALPELAFTVEAAEVMRRLTTVGVKILAGAVVARVDRETVRLTSGDEMGPFDSIILSTGTLPRPVADGAVSVGDCVAPRGFWAAVDDAMRLVERL